MSALLQYGYEASLESFLVNVMRSQSEVQRRIALSVLDEYIVITGPQTEYLCVSETLFSVTKSCSSWVKPTMAYRRNYF